MLDGDTAEEAASALSYMAFVVLRQQIESSETGMALGNHVPPKRLSRRERKLLADAFRTADRLRGRVSGELSGNVLTGGGGPRPG